MAAEQPEATHADPPAPFSEPTHADWQALPGWARAIDRANQWLGRCLGWLVLALILLQVALVIMQGVFRVSSIQLAELLLYLNAAVFLGGAGYALSQEEQVRVDIFYRDASRRERGEVDSIGTWLFLIPMLGLLLWAGGSYVASSWAVLETSVESSGLPFVYLLKSLILVFVLVLGAQALVLLAKARMNRVRMNRAHTDRMAGPR